MAKRPPERVSQNGAGCSEYLRSLAGAQRATVNQVLRNEEKRGLLELHRGRTRILDLDALSKRAR